MRKEGFEFSFTWIFVLLVGAAILSIAVFASFKFIDTGQTRYNSQVAAQLGAVLSPLETGVESGKAYDLTLPDESKLDVECDESGTFGSDKIQVSVRSGIGQEWQKNGVPYELSNKFVVVEPKLEAKKVHVFSTPINLPYKVGDIILLYSKTYCLVNAPSNVQDDLTFLQAEGLRTASQARNCPEGSVVVCFGSSSGCNVSVSLDSAKEDRGEVTKGGRHVPYLGQMMYAAIMADPREYSCELNRIRKRASELSNLYNAKTNFLASKGCSSLLAAGLDSYSARLLDSRISFDQIIGDSEALERENDRLTCKLF